MTQTAILALTQALSTSAEAHDLDCRGMPVPQAEKRGCCGAGDSRRMNGATLTFRAQKTASFMSLHRIHP
jgi:hypothetical protein